MTSQYKICTRCVMDTTDPDISFDNFGVCNHCSKYDQLQKKFFSVLEGQQKLGKLIERIKKDGKGKEYDCVIGVSGGVDSTFVALKVKELGLRPLAVHLDNSWDSELAVNNIHKALQKLDIDLYTHVIDWEEFRELQLSFLRASTPDSEIPSDHAIVALMHQMAEKIGTRYIISGYNFKTESHLPVAWAQGHFDWRYIQTVHKKFSSIELKTFPHMDLLTLNKYRLTQKMINILDFLDYVKADAMEILKNSLGWKYYGGKHYESIYTRFFQGYILPKKFGYDKRRSHFSSLICSGEMTRQEALENLELETYPSQMQDEDKAYVIKKLRLTEETFDQIMNLPRKSYWDYPSYGKWYRNPIYIGLRGIYHFLSQSRLN